MCKGKMVVCFLNCSDLLREKKCSSDREKLLKFEAEDREFAKSKFLKQQAYVLPKQAFLTYFWNNWDLK